MKKLNKLIALLLTLVLVLGMLPMVSYAANGSDDDALILDKTFDRDSGMLTLEAYATGKTVTTITETTLPCDIVLVLDVSGSMEDPYTGASGYIATTQSFTVNNISRNTWYYYDGGKYYKVNYERIQDEEPTVTKENYLQCYDVTTAERSNWTLYKDGDTQYYCKVGNEYKPIYYKMSGNGFVGRYYCFAYLDSNNQYVPLYGTTAPDRYNGLKGSSYLSFRGDVYTMTTLTHYRLYYTDGSGQKVYFGNSVTENDDTIYSGTLYRYATISGSKLDALKLAVDGFIDTVAVNAAGPDGIAGTDDDVDHKISVVKFAADTYYGSKESLAEGNHRSSGENYTEVVKNLTSVDEDGAAELKTAVDSLREGGATAADYGMTKAGYVLAEPNARADSNKIVVLFTDGEPNHGSGFSGTVANSTITKSKSLKDAGVTVFSIGLFPSNVNRNTPNYMEGVSSDYPNATAYDRLGTRADTGYFIDASADNIDLRDVFKTVAEQSTEGGAAIQLSQSSILRDVISKYFDLPANADATSITAHSETRQNGQWISNNDSSAYTISIEEDRKTINVEGFDYSKYYVDASSELNANGEYGRKIVVQIPVVMNTAAVVEDGYLVDDPTALIPTNEGSSAIYDDTDGDPETPPELIEPFPIPDTECDTFTIVHCGATTPEALHTSERYLVPDDTFDLTEVVNDGVLYGGTFTDEDCTEPATDDATKFKPEAGKTYYMWEVSKAHLLPKNLCAYRPTDGNAYFVEDVYLITAIDRNLYSSVGFLISGKNDNDTNVDVAVEQSTIFNTITAIQSGVKVGETSYYDLYKSSSPDPETTKNSLVACYHFVDLMGKKFNSFDSSSDQFKFQPYWVTCDGVRVLNTSVVRNAYYQGVGYTSLKVSDTDWSNSYITPRQYMDAPVTSGAPLKLMNNYAFGQESEGTQELLSAAEYEQEEPAPFVPVKPAEAEKVTVYDGTKTYEARIIAGSVSLKADAPEGKVFAGWFTDPAYTKPADLSAVSNGMEIYAKYVSDVYLNVKYTDSILMKKLTLVSALDSTDYVKTGFVIDAGGARQAVTVSNYTNSYLLSSAKTLFGSAVAKGSPLMVYTYSFSGLRKNASIKVTPYWITADGTVVYGEERVLTYTGFSIKG